VRLLAIATNNWWLFNGYCQVNGFNPFKSDFADFCDVAYYWMSRNLDEAEQAKLDEMLGTPPLGDISDAPGWSVEEQMDAFNAF
jgi:hypothetical protein